MVKFLRLIFLRKFFRVRKLFLIKKFESVLRVFNIFYRSDNRRKLLD